MISDQQNSQKFQVMEFDLDAQQQEEARQKKKTVKSQTTLKQQAQTTSMTRNQPTLINSLDAFKKNFFSQDKNHLKFFMKQKVHGQSQLKIYDISFDCKSENRSEIDFVSGTMNDDSKEGQGIADKQKQESSEKLNNKDICVANSDLLCPQVEIWSLCYKFLDSVYERLQNSSTNLSFLHNFLHTPLSSLENSNYMRYIFEIHLYKFQFTFNTYFEFYLRKSNGEMINLLKSEKDGLSVSSSHLLYVFDPNNSSKKEFTAKLKYNTLKTEYNLYNVDEKEQKNVQRNLLATVFYDKRFGQQRQITMYVPKLEHKHESFIKSEQKKNLLSFYDVSQPAKSRKIQKLKTSQILKFSEQKVRQQFSLKNQGRRILVENEEGVEKFYMGKRQQERYIILGAGGMTPLQIFTLAVVNLEH